MNSAVIPLLVRLPLFVIWLIGIIIAIIRWKRYPWVSISLIIALIIFATTTILNVILASLIPQLLTNFRATELNLALFAERSLPFIEMIGWILVLIAVFSNRRTNN